MRTKEWLAWSRGHELAGRKPCLAWRVLSDPHGTDLLNVLNFKIAKLHKNLDFHLFLIERSDKHGTHIRARQQRMELRSGCPLDRAGDLLFAQVLAVPCYSSSLRSATVYHLIPGPATHFPYLPHPGPWVSNRWPTVTRFGGLSFNTYMKWYLSLSNSFLKMSCNSQHNPKQNPSRPFHRNWQDNSEMHGCANDLE